MAARKAHERLYTFDQGEILVREGDPINEMFIIKQGRVRATRNVNGREVNLTIADAGEVLGVMGVVERKPQYATLRALEHTVVYRMDMKELMESAGGSELPVSGVLTGLSVKLRTLANQLVRSGRQLDSDSTLI